MAFEDWSRRAPTEHPTHELVVRRWSPRAFSDRRIDHETARSLLEAARWAPSSFNEQPWAFVVGLAQEPLAFNRILKGFIDKNQSWSKDAAMLGVAFARREFTKTGKPNRHAFFDVGAALAWLTVEATARDLFVHQLAGIDREAITQEFGVPDDFEVVAGFAVGYVGEASSLPSDLAARETAERRRRPQSEWVGWGDFPSGV